MSFFHFSQNNSGGDFVFDEKVGISCHVVIEAKDGEAANAIAEGIGLYFDGCESGRDCDCCGDRWSRVWRKGDKAPKIFGKPTKTFKPTFLWMKGKPEGFIHYANGRIAAISGQPCANRTK